MKKSVFIAMFAATVVSEASASEGIYTLYRSSIVSSEWRIHVATFDAAEGDKYNSENCQLAAQLFLSQPGVRTLFWCEPGRFQESN